MRRLEEAAFEGGAKFGLKPQLCAAYWLSIRLFPPKAASPGILNMAWQKALALASSHKRI